MVVLEPFGRHILRNSCILPRLYPLVQDFDVQKQRSEVRNSFSRRRRFDFFILYHLHRHRYGSNPRQFH